MTYPVDSALRVASPSGLLRTLAALLALSAAACGGPDRRGDSGGDGAAPDASADAEPPLAPGLHVLPSDPVLVSEDGATPALALRVVRVTASGAREEVAPMVVTWTLEHERVGALSADGVFTANGVAAGAVTVRASAPDSMRRLENAQTTVRVRVVRRVVAPDVTPDAAARFDPPARVVDDPSRQARVVYPLDNAFMPANVAPPDVQWDVGEPGDALRVRLTRGDAAVTAVLHHSGVGFGNHWAVPPAAWRSLVESATDSAVPVELAVDRYDAAAREVVRGATLRLRIAAGGAFGAVYYWGLSDRDSTLYRIAVESGARAPVFAPGVGCAGCHELSHDGRWLVAPFPGGGTRAIDLTADLSTVPPPSRWVAPRGYDATAYGPGAAQLFASFRALVPGDDTRSENVLALVDGATGRVIDGDGAVTVREASSPAWTPDGAHLAFVRGGSDALFLSTPTDIGVIDRDATSGTFSAPRVLHRGADLAGSAEGGATDSHPAWSPDGAFVAFAHGTRSVSEGAPDNARAAIYLLAREPSGTAARAPVRLTRGMGRATDLAWWPTFSPFVTREADGRRLYWLSYYSLQDYGNEAVGTRGRGRRQLWVTAIDPALAAQGRDPSQPPFWLPGQDTHSENMAARWAPAACRASGAECTVSSQCCSGACRPDPADPSRATCQAPPPGQCRRYGQTCGASSECCGGLVCTVNVCDTAPPG